MASSKMQKRAGGIGGMECLIPVINDLQDVLDQTGTNYISWQIQLPLIAVVGSQSSGKSSVLENLVGQPFLPRGNGIVTRCPIVLRLVHTKGNETWCEFEHRPNRRYENFADVEREIVAETERIAGTNSGISKENIKLTVNSPNVLTLTGRFTRIPTGDQPGDIEAQIEDLVMEYISQPNTIILAVSPGNVDIANSDSIKLAKKVDPQQERTIAVVTKLDLAEDVSDVLMGQTVPMKLGIVGVVNRSQQDIEDNKPNKDVIRDEKDFLNSKYRTIANKHGIHHLVQKLNTILMQHIQKCCPSLDIRIKELANKTKERLEDLGSEEEMTDAKKSEELITTIDRFSKQYKAQVDGQSRSEIETGELTGGARMDYVFRTTLNADLDELSLLETLSDMEIMIAIRNSAPVGSRMIHPEAALEYLIKKEVKKMKPVALHCANLVHQEMVGIINKCVDPRIRFPNVVSEISAVVEELLNKQAEVARQILENYIDVQSSSGWTANHDYHNELTEVMKGVNTVDLGYIPAVNVLNFGGADPLLTLSGGQSFSDSTQAGLSAQQEEVCTYIRDLIKVIFEIVRNQVQDHVPKSLMHSLIYSTADQIGIELNKKLRDPETANRLFREPDDIAERRALLSQELEKYKKASKLLDEVRFRAT